MTADTERRLGRIELTAVILVGVFHVVTELNVSPVAAYIYNVAACIAFLCYLAWRVVRNREVLQEWGLRRDNFWAALRVQARFAVLAAAAVVGFGFLAETLPLPRSFWMIVALYPLWGIAQQFALQNLVGRNLATLVRQPILHAFLTALLFSASHYPNVRLMILTLVAGFFFTLVYVRRPNLWAVGILHGFLGALAYYLVLGEDPGQALVAYLAG